MAISNYTELQTAVGNWLDREDLTSRIPEFIALGEAKISRRLRSRPMQTTSTASVNTEFFTLPTDFAAAISLTLTLNGQGVVLTPTDAATIAMSKEGSTATSWPMYYAVLGSQIQVYPSPDTTYTASLIYVQRVPALSVSAPTNWLLTLAPDVYLYAAVVEAALFLRDNELITTARALFDDSIDGLQWDQRQITGPLRTEVAPLAGRHTFNINRGW